MSSRTAFLNTSYGGYLHREIPPEDEELTHVGPGTPCGEWLRRFWHPVGYTLDLQDLPRRVRFLGEDLVLFKDGSGDYGLMELHCPHRGTSLEFGQTCHEGIRCCYHGWLIDVDGRILETPGEPANSTLKDRLYHGAYPTHEYHGIVFGYMGPPDKRPPFPIYDTYELPGYSMNTLPQHHLPCNWLQVKENSLDPSHLDFLHTIEGNPGFTRQLQLHSELDWMETPNGAIYISSRRVGDNVWVRMGNFIPPNVHEFPEGLKGGSEQRYGPPEITRWAVPVDDENTLVFSFKHIAPGDKDKPVRLGFGQTNERSYEERQRVPGDYDAQASQRIIARHGAEHLASTDRGIIILRNIVRKGIQAVQQGEDPDGIAWPKGKSIPTYAGDTVQHIPQAPTPETDIQLLRDTGRKVAEGYFKDPPASRPRTP